MPQGTAQQAQVGGWRLFRRWTGVQFQIDRLLDDVRIGHLAAVGLVAVSVDPRSYSGSRPRCRGPCASSSGSGLGRKGGFWSRSIGPWVAAVPCENVLHIAGALPGPRAIAATEVREPRRGPHRLSGVSSKSPPWPQLSEAQKRGTTPSRALE
eukprot:CAMPEP_0180693474 /NCGR_PEP_ID=MMETSP1038_2-20121128/1380_1 /TAXON_ID=632150 /ORGANISM="Azadinium spinosum, Strain 3D9" /LENGTH=152 /DNA_ID=CAMNT_0022724719 /DNA_START=192 /DNA_END=647 /DNA_ORIENTATION=-